MTAATIPTKTSDMIISNKVKPFLFNALLLIIPLLVFCKQYGQSFPQIIFYGYLQYTVIRISGLYLDHAVIDNSILTIDTCRCSRVACCSFRTNLGLKAFPPNDPSIRHGGTDCCRPRRLLR